MPIDAEVVQYAYTSVPSEDAHERQVVGRIAAGIWAAIAFFGALSTVKPLRFPEIDVSATRLVVLSATVIAYASGAVSNGLVALVTFAIALAVCFLPVRTSVAEVVVIAVFLAAGLVLIAEENAGVDALRTSLLLSVLLVLCGLVLILRAAIAQREAAVGHPIFDGGLHDASAFDKTLDRELSRAARHERPLSVLLLEVSGSQDSNSRPDANDERVVATVASALLERVRTEDSVCHLGGLRFGVIAPETPAAGAASVAETASGVIRNRIESFGYSPASFHVVVGWADYPHHADTRDGLVSAAQHNLDSAAVQDELRRPSPLPAEGPSRSRPATAGPDQA
jgi:diguanylate cyclase (GGDEF)-like protein